MQKENIRSILCFITVITMFFSGCSNNGDDGVMTNTGNITSSVEEDSDSQTANQIGNLTIVSYGPDRVTLRNDGGSTAPGANMQAYIGLNGAIHVDSEFQVHNALQEPLDLSGGSCTFTGLEQNRSYRIYVIAMSEDCAPQIKYLNLIRPEYAEIDPEDYLAMSDEEFGQLKWTLKIADDDLDDFSRIESLNLLGIPLTGALQVGFCSYRYSVAFADYFLASVQYHKLPACQDIIKNRMDRLIQKMIHKKVWDYWYITSTGIYTFIFSDNFGKNFDLFYPAERDPIRVKNIMYSGHLAQMIALYEKLYGDMKWSQPGSIEFTWSENEKYVYDNNSLHKLLRDMFVTLPDHCIECEPNTCYPECNQHPILALKVYDQVHGTNYYEECEPLLFDWFVENEIINPETHDTSGVYLTLSDKTIGPENWDLGNILSVLSVPLTEMINFYFAFAAADAWTGAFMHAWEPEYIEEHYSYQKAHRINDEGRLKPDIVSDQLAVALFAIYAAELGDYEIRDNLLEQCDELYDPAWTDDGAYYYPVGPIDTTANPFYYHNNFANSVTASLIGIARATPKDGLLALHSDPVPGAGGPTISDIDMDKAKLLRAVYDQDREVLVATVDKEDLTMEGDTDLIKIDNLDPDRTWHLKIDNSQVQIYTGVSALHVEIELDGRHDIILAAE